MFAQIRKALVPLFVGLAIAVLAHFGVVPTPDVVQTVTLIITAVLVYFIPNEPRG